MLLVNLVWTFREIEADYKHYGQILKIRNGQFRLYVNWERFDV